MSDGLTCCGAAKWEHDLFDGQCPPPDEPNACCGALGISHDVAVLCSNGRCTEWFCRCGVFMGVSAGPVGCNCDKAGNWSSNHLAQRRMIRVPAGRVHHRRYRNRTRTKR